MLKRLSECPWNSKNFILMTRNVTNPTMSAAILGLSKCTSLGVVPWLFSFIETSQWKFQYYTLVLSSFNIRHRNSLNQSFDVHIETLPPRVSILKLLQAPKVSILNLSYVKVSMRFKFYLAEVLQLSGAVQGGENGACQFPPSQVPVCCEWAVSGVLRRNG